jgi:signal transduction histidine kinase
MSYFALAALVNTISCFGLAIFFLSKRKNKPINNTFFYYALVVCFWSASYFFWQISNTESSALFWTKILSVWMTLIPIFSTKFNYKLLGKKENNRLILALYIFSALFILSDIGTGLVSKVVPIDGFKYWPMAGRIGIPFLIVWLGVIIYNINMLWSKFRHSVAPYKSQYGLFLFATIIAYLGGISNYPLWWRIPILPWGNIGVTFYVLIIAYGILAKNLFNIRLAVSRTIVYTSIFGIILAAYGATVFILISLFNTTFNWGIFLTNIISATIIGFSFEPIRNFLQEKTDHFLFKKEYEQQEVLKKLSDQLNNVLNMDEALSIVTQNLNKYLHLKSVLTVVFDNTDGNTTNVQYFKQAGYSGKKDIAIKDKDFFIPYFSQNTQILLTNELEDTVNLEKQQLGQISHTKKLDLSGHAIKFAVLNRLKELSVYLTLPLCINDRLIGLTMVGNKLNNDAFNMQDLDLIESIGSETIAAIEKARLFEGDQMKNEFISIASHELLTPISAMEGYISIVLKDHVGVVDKQAEDYLQKVYTSTQRLSLMVKDLLAASRLESGRIKLVLENVKIEKIIQETIDQFKIMSEEKKIPIIFDNQATNTEVFGDQARIFEILTNLISNALKYTQKGQITVRTEIKGSQMFVNVQDTGIGIAKKDQVHLFQKFYRIQNEKTLTIMGTGLGLYIIKNMIEKMNGTITFHSIVDQGTTFTFNLPIVKTTPS